MHHHASLTAHLPSLSLVSLFQAAAGKAWARTRPTRAYHRTSVRAEGVAPSTLRVARREIDDAAETGGPSASMSSNPGAAASPSLHDCRLRVPSSVPHFSVSPLGPQAAPLAHDPGTNAEQASPGPAPSPSHSPRRNFVTPVNVESLSPECFVSPYDDQSLSSAYESDPPWEEIRDSVPESLLPRISLRRLPTPKQLPMIPDPSTSEELLANLTLAATAPSPASLGQLLSYHARHRTLRTTASFNLLIRMAIRNASFGTVKDLLGRMVREGIPGDLETRTLRVRCMVRTGFWNKAWREELVRRREDDVDMPLPVWLEFFDDVKRGAMLVRPANQGHGQAKGVVPLLPPDHSVSAGRVNALLQHPPLVTPADLAKVPPRVVYAVVRSLVALDRQQAAIVLTTSYFQSLPHELDEEWRRSCLSIIHLHLKPGRRRNLSGHYAVRKTLFDFLGMHRSFRPTSTTLFFLLRSLLHSKRCGERAEAVSHSFAKRWGPDVVDDAVRRRLASYWLKQGNAARAQAIFEAQNQVNEQRKCWRAEKEVVVGDSFKDRARRLRWLDLHRGPRKHKNRWLWRMVRRRLRRLQVRRS